MTDKEKNYYNILGVAENASFAEIKFKYFQAKKAFNQESLALYSLMGEDDLGEHLEDIEEAYSVLSIPEKRREFDSIHGLNPNLKDYDSLISTDEKKYESFQDKDQDSNSEDKSTRHTGSTRDKIHSLVANNKYALKYEMDPEFEQVIEQTTEFSGELLKKIREYKNVDLVRMSEMTKVSKIHLKNIESEDIAKLPAFVYIRGFVYQYAKCLKLCPELVATSYLNRIKEL